MTWPVCWRSTHHCRRTASPPFGGNAMAGSSWGRNRGQVTNSMEQSPHLLVPISREAAVPRIAVPASRHLGGCIWPVSVRRRRGPPPLVPGVGHRHPAVRYPGPRGQMSPKGWPAKSRLPPGQLPQLPKASSAFNRVNAPYSSAGQRLAEHESCAARLVGPPRNLPISWASSWTGPDGRSGAS